MNTDGLVHQIGWSPAALSEKPLAFEKVVFFVGREDRDETLSAYQRQLNEEGLATEVASNVTDLGRLLTPGTIVVHFPYAAKTKDDIFEASTKACTTLIEAAQTLSNSQSKPKLFSLISKDSGLGDLSRSPLNGLSRVIKLEIPDIFGGLFEEDEGRFPLSAIRHAQGFDVVKVTKGVAQSAALKTCLGDPNTFKELQLDPAGTYLITGGTRGMGLELADWFGERGARSILLVSRGGIPKGSDGKPEDKFVSTIARLEALGATVHVLAIDFSEPGAGTILSQSIDKLGVPPVKGVVHAAGIAGYHTLDKCTPSDIAPIMAPKVIGALSLDALYPPGTLDFLVLISSIGQLVGFQGQLSYAAANSFLEGLAAYRRSQGDNSTSILWSSWRGVGLMAQSKSATRMITKGMQARGIETMSREEALEAWDLISNLGIDHAAVVRATELEPNEPLRHPILKDITPRRQIMPRPTATKFNSYPPNAVAVVGMACRTPAGDTPDDLWEIIQAGKSMARDIDLKRFPDAAGKGKLFGNFMSDIDSFDHQFFKKSKREAAALDPHQRLLLETTYHALEAAGCFGGGQPQERLLAETHETTDGTHITGCFIGMNAPDYPLNLACHPTSPYTGFGMLRSFVSGRLSHHFGWTGPSQTIDTACSSAMVAIHQACRAIELGECTRAVAGGVNLITNLALFEALRVGGFLNETGPCKTFDARADGYCRGESVGVVVLKRLDRAISDGDDIQGVLLSTGNNQNVNTTSITNPVLVSQVALCKDVLARAGVNPKDVSYVEAHGTGTRAGDPIETGSIRQVLGGKDRRTTLHVGAIKPNVGHSEGGSGVISLIKVLLMLKYGKLVPQANFETLNPNIPALEPDKMAISTTLTDWRDGLRLALVNSFGASGNNAAAVVAPPPPSPSDNELASPVSSISTWPFIITSFSASSLSAYCNKLKEQISNGTFTPELTSHLAFGLATKQNRQLQQVFSTTATTLDELQAQLSDPTSYTAVAPKPKPVVLLFSGQNGNTVQSAKPMYDSSVLFRTYLHKCDEIVQALGAPSLFPAILEGIQGEDDLVLRHAAMFAIQYACGMSWIDSGVKPQAICGHSFGEWAALTVSGALTLEAGRASIIKKLWGDDTGSMCAIEADLVDTNRTPAQHIEPFVKEHPSARLDIACYNGPNNYVAAGSTADIEVLESYLREKKNSGEKLRFKVLKGMHAYHSVKADPIIEESGKLSASIPFQDPTLPFESCQGEPWTGPGTNVIARNTRGPVYFSQAISRIVDRLGPSTFLEAGIGGPIIAMARNALPQQQGQAEHTFVALNGKDPVRSLADATVTLWKTGQMNVQFWPFHKSQKASYAPVTLPPYQFDKNSHWLECTGFSGGNGTQASVHEPAALSGRCPHCLKTISDYPYISHDKSQSQGENKAVFKVDVRSRRFQDLVSGHVVAGTPICPAGMYLELASHAVALLLNIQPTTQQPEIAADSLEIRAPLSLDTERSVTMTLTKQKEGTWAFELASTKNSSKPSSHGTGVITVRSTSSKNNEQDEKTKWDRISNLLEKETDTETMRGAIVYKVFSEVAKYSPPYKGMRHLAGKGSEGAGDIAMPTDEPSIITKTPNDCIADPVVMDNFLQVPGAFMSSLRGPVAEEDSKMAYICTGMGSVGPLNALQGNGEYRAYTEILQEDKKEVLLNVSIFSKQSKKIVWAAKGLKFARALRASLERALAAANPQADSKKQAATPSTPAPQSQAVSSQAQAPSAPPKKASKREENSIDVLGGVQQVLSKSLDVPVEEVTKQAALEDLGLDSLVASEILANISDKFSVNIPTDDFSAVADVGALCTLISSKLGNGVADSGDGDGDAEDSAPEESISEAAGGSSEEWRKKIFEILGQSLGLPVEEIQMDSALEDLGVDSLVSGEIISNLNEAFSIDVSSDEFSSISDVISLCSLITRTLRPDAVHTPTDSSSGTSQASSASRTPVPMTPYTGATTPIESEKLASASQNSPGWVHTAFQQIRRSVEVHAKDTKFTGYWDEVYPQQLTSVTAFIVEAFEKLGVPIAKFKQGEKLPAVQGTLAKFQREVLRLWEVLEEAGVVEKVGNDFLRGPASVDFNESAGKLSTKLVSEFTPYISTHGLSDLLGPQLAECLTGKADPVTLLFGSEKGRNYLEDYYANAPDLKAATKVLCDFFSALVHSQSSGGEPLRILEIGAGTGGTTKHLVPLLESTGLPYTYTFTELSAALLARAKKTFRGNTNMEFRKLDLEQNPPEELLGRYHVVISTNCVHATSNLRRSLTNIRKMVRPHDGCVALVEVTQKIAWYELVWGLLDGWWLFDDGREYPLQSPWAWESALKDSGFANVNWSEGWSRESRTSRVICGMTGEQEGIRPIKATSMLLHQGAPGRNLFLAPDGFGSGAVFGALQPLLDGVKNLSVYALNSPFIKNKPNPDDRPTVEEQAAIYVAEIKRRQPKGPYQIGGYSIGGVFAYEIARQLLEDGNEVEKLFLIDTACPVFASSVPDNLVQFLDSIDRLGMVDEDNIRTESKGRPISSDHFTLSREQLARYKISKLPGRKIPKAVLVSAREGVDKQDKVPRPEVQPEAQGILEWFLNDRTDDGPLRWDEVLGTGNVSVIRANGNHFSMMKLPNIDKWGLELAKEIAA